MEIDQRLPDFIFPGVTVKLIDSRRCQEERKGSQRTATDQVLPCMQANLVHRLA